MIDAFIHARDSVSLPRCLSNIHIGNANAVREAIKQTGAPVEWRDVPDEMMPSCMAAEFGSVWATSNSDMSDFWTAFHAIRSHEMQTAPDHSGAVVVSDHHNLDQNFTLAPARAAPARFTRCGLNHPERMGCPCDQLKALSCVPIEQPTIRNAPSREDHTACTS